MTESKVSHQGEGGGVPSRDALYRKVAKKAEICIDYLVDVVEGKIPAHPVRMAAAKVLLNKVIPDLKVTELQGNPERPLGVVILPQVNEQPKNNLATPPGTADGSVKAD